MLLFQTSDILTYISYFGLQSFTWIFFLKVGSRTAEVLENKYGSIYEVGSAAKLLYPASGLNFRIILESYLLFGLFFKIICSLIFSSTSECGLSFDVIV